MFTCLHWVPYHHILADKAAVHHCVTILPARQQEVNDAMQLVMATDLQHDKDRAKWSQLELHKLAKVAGIAQTCFQCSQRWVLFSL